MFSRIWSWNAHANCPRCWNLGPMSLGSVFEFRHWAPAQSLDSYEQERTVHFCPCDLALDDTEMSRVLNLDPIAELRFAREKAWCLSLADHHNPGVYQVNDPLQMCRKYVSTPASGLINTPSQNKISIWYSRVLNQWGSSTQILSVPDYQILYLRHFTLFQIRSYLRRLEWVLGEFISLNELLILPRLATQVMTWDLHDIFICILSRTRRY